MICQAVAIKRISDDYFYCESAKEYRYDLVHTTLYDSVSCALKTANTCKLKDFHLVYVQLKEQVICY